MKEYPTEYALNNGDLFSRLPIECGEWTLIKGTKPIYGRVIDDWELRGDSLHIYLGKPVDFNPIPPPSFRAIIVVSSGLDKIVF